jgi:valyl-tRNA synthetase
VILRLFAPFLPFVTEEAWSWWREGSIHAAAWPVPGELPAGGDPSVLTAGAEVLRRLRKAKSEARVSMRAEVARAEVAGQAVAQVALVEADLRAAGRIADLDLRRTSDAGLGVEVTLASE